MCVEKKKRCVYLPKRQQQLFLFVSNVLASKNRKEKEKEGLLSVWPCGPVKYEKGTTSINPP